MKNDELDCACRSESKLVVDDEDLDKILQLADSIRDNPQRDDSIDVYDIDFMLFGGPQSSAPVELAAGN